MGERVCREALFAGALSPAPRSLFEKEATEKEVIIGDLLGRMVLLLY